MKKLRIEEVVVVEGKYDATALHSVVDALIIPTNGFAIFTDEEKKSLIRRLGKKRGILLLTDSDAAGFRIRHYLEKIASGCKIKNAYSPALAGKERRKDAPSKEGMLGVEGMSAKVLQKVLQAAGANTALGASEEPVTYTDLYNLGISGKSGSAKRRQELMAQLDLPPRLSKRALCQVVSSLYTREEFFALASQMSGTCEE